MSQRVKHQSFNRIRDKPRSHWLTVWLNKTLDFIKSLNPVAGEMNLVNPHNGRHSAHPCQSMTQRKPHTKHNNSLLFVTHLNITPTLSAHPPPPFFWFWYCSFSWLVVKYTFFGSGLKINTHEDIDRCVRTRTEMLSCRKKLAVICLSLLYGSPLTPWPCPCTVNCAQHCDLLGMLTELIQHVSEILNMFLIRQYSDVKASSWD